MKIKKRIGFCASILLLLSILLVPSVFAEKPSKTELQTKVEACSSLQTLEIKKSSIGLPTTGASITTAEFTQQNGEEFCQVKGEIHPVDHSAPNINFQVNLPSEWNQKVLQMGGGGFNGSVVSGLGKNGYDPKTVQAPLERGFVTFGSDSGHVSTGWDASFAMNDEALANFAGDQLKKTHDVAMELIKTYYKEKPNQVYFSGGSEGGREALVAIQRWPQDYDGAVVFYPVYNWIAKAVQDNRNMQILYKNNGEGWISPDDNTLINETVLAACDTLDGAKDGIISNLNDCEYKKSDILSDLSKAGLTKAQIEVINTFDSPMEFSFTLANKFSSIAGYSQFQGADVGIAAFSQYGPTPAPFDFSQLGSMSQFSDQVLRYMVTKNPNLDTFTFDPNEWKQEIKKASKLLEASSPNLSAFKALGGKLILIHGSADQIVTPYGTVEYWETLQDRFRDKLDQFAKFYIVPGYGHGYGAFTMSSDLLGALDSWVVNGIEPTNLITADQNMKRTRPLCEFPYWPEYDGSGDINDASNYSCAR
ncbi:tannase/feruloyl esterase family alpha/beta hydrolase [Bacillus timonensis]|uniref:tannase/feruloyl esterase family alpha/beta hydrolase n=1 Tax=Bacillus timonensis TaxID=1033734 RepID=UPI000288A4A9|nr:tannase/feruloyl esterase family alpha/beta hydrolase [Bacillus timonensis]